MGGVNGGKLSFDSTYNRDDDFMSLKKCKDCGGVVSSNAKACPTCGAKVTKSVGILGWLFVIFIVLPIAWNFGKGMGVATDVVAKQEAGKASTAKTDQVSPVAEKPVSDKPSWSVRTSKDAMTDIESTHIMLRSVNSAAFDFPYRVPGGSYLTMTVRKKPGDMDVIFRIDKGQMLCSSLECKFTLRIDDKPVQTWTGVPSATHSSELMFVRDAVAFERLILNGGKIRVGIEFYKEGTRVFEFDPEGYPGQ